MIVNNYPSVSIIVPVYNGGNFLHKCINSLLKIDYPKESLEIIFVDNNSTDNSKEIIKCYPVKYLSQHNKKGEIPTILCGINHAKGEIIAITDADCVVSRGWIKELIHIYMEDDKYGGVGGEIEAFEPKTWLELFQKECDEFPQKRNLNLGNPGMHCMLGANSSHRRDVLEDKELEKEFISYPIPYGKDLIISCKILMKGYKLGYAPRGIVYHKLRDSYPKICEQYFRYGSSFECAISVYGRYSQQPNYHSLRKGLWCFCLLFIEMILSFTKEVFNQKKPFVSRYYLLCAVKELFLNIGRIYMRFYFLFKKSYILRK